MIDLMSQVDNRKDVLKSLKKQLNPQEYYVMILRFYTDATLKEIADNIGVATAERVRQIEAKALRKLRNPFGLLVITFREERGLQ